MRTGRAFGDFAGLLARKGDAATGPRTGETDERGWTEFDGSPRPRLAFGTPAASADQPLVLRQRDELAARMNAGGPDDVPARRIRSRAKGLDDGKKAAFTLRFDAERHRKLRIACALSGKSAQAIVMQALDEFLETVPADAGFRQD